MRTKRLVLKALCTPTSRQQWRHTSEGVHHLPALWSRYIYEVCIIAPDTVRLHGTTSNQAEAQVQHYDRGSSNFCQ